MENWQIEMQHLLDMFERESTITLRKINRYLVASGQPFGENFRKYFLKMSNLRLDSSFNSILIEHEYRMQMTPTTDASSVDGIKIAQNPRILHSTARDQTGVTNTKADENVWGLKIENNVGALIEIVDSSGDEDVVLEQKCLISSGESRGNTLVDEDVSVSTVRNNIHAPIEIPNSTDENNDEKSEMQAIVSANGGYAESNELNHDGNDANDENINADLNNQNDVEFDVKSDLKMESPNETEVHLPLVEFNPNADNGDFYVGDIDTDTDSLYDQNQPSTSSNTGMQSERGHDERLKCNKCAYTTQNKWHLKSHQLIHDSSAVKQFKCKHCSYATRYKCALKKHQKIHAHQKLMGIDCHSNDGLYKCSHCNRQFTKWYGLRKHLMQSHKNNQRLFNCERCTRQFTRKSLKDKHELRCEGRRYECYICRKYVTRNVCYLQRHMRTHSGAKPSECMVCNKCFRLNGALNVHLKRVHGHMSA